MDVKNFVLSYYKNAAKDFHIVRITAPTEALKPHNHNYFQIYYVISGMLIHHVENSVAKLSAGDVFILPPNLPHYIEDPDGTADFYSMSFLTDYFQNTNESNKLVLDFLYYLHAVSPNRILPKFTLSYEDLTFSEVLFRRIMDEFLSENTGKYDIIKSCVSALLSVYARVYFEGNAGTLLAEKNKQLVLHCIGYIKNHFDEDLTLSEMVRLSAMSKTCFCSLFTSITGTTFKDYLNRYRIEKAVEYIHQEEKISTVCSRCGFNDFSTFYRNFKKYKGVSPYAFIKQTAITHADGTNISFDDKSTFSL